MSEVSEEVSEAREAVQRERTDRLRTDYHDTFSDGAGRRVLEDLCRYGNILSSCHEQGDPYTSALHEGQREIVIHILNMLQSGLDENGDIGSSLEYANEQLPSYFGTGEQQ